MKWRTFSMFSAIAAAGLFVLGCSSSQPPVPQQAAVKAQAPAPQQPPPITVTDVKMTAPTTDGAPYRVEGAISPQGPAGPADVTFRLRNRATGEVVQTGGQVQLTPGVVLVAVGEIQAPRADYTPEVEVKPLR